MKASALANTLLETGPDDVPAKDYLRALPAHRNEVWAFTADELMAPHNCKGTDELVSTVSTDPNDEDQENEANLVHIAVLRNGTVTDHFVGDRRSVVPPDLKQLAYEDETLYSPAANDIADKWREVVADVYGNFVRFGKL